MMRGARPVSPSPLAYAAIAVVVAALAGSFAWAAGWLSPQGLTPARMVDALSARGGDPRGHRRNHSKGVCFTGYLQASGAGAGLTTAPMLAVPGRYPVIGRFAIAVGDPAAPDLKGRVRSMAIRVTAPGGAEWRSGMNNSPVFVVGTPQAFYDLTRAQDLDPRTGKPDPGAMARFTVAHPESAAFAHWAKTAPWSASWADQTYNSLNAFRFIDAQGRRRTVRWSMVPAQAAAPVSAVSLKTLGPDFLTRDLDQRLAAGPLRWRLLATLAGPGAPSADATRAWPAGRPQVQLGELVVERAEPEVDGPCRDYNYDPLVLPRGVAPSDDPLLAARASAYAESFDRRTAEAGRYRRMHGSGS